ncbi:FKBP-type peptidyl-prolyl cis-trans isomerase [Pantoea stewartii]|uniref:FKBP-type peptidyl-prolyl cis-trans isomerase n=1 Tax=Pantoea stewartii TaxID=66269 RepID=UPI001562E517|nr:FKBP-type peptidyl-prolyl cis-trans isomerase [Pantoea stewartii]NRH23410.1 hypothetical protein [Pantoea stewartii]
MAMRFIYQIIIVFFLLFAVTSAQANEEPALFKYARQWQKENNASSSEIKDSDRTADLRQIVSPDERLLRQKLDKMHKDLISQQALNRDLQIRIKDRSALANEKQYAEQQMVQTQSALDKLKANYEQLQSQLTSLKNENSQLSTKLVAADEERKKINELQTLLAAKTLESEALAVKNTELTNRITSQQMKEKNNAIASNAQKYLEVKQLQSEMEKMKINHAELSNLTESMRSTIDEKNKKIAELIRRNQNLERQVSEAVKALRTFQSESEQQRRSESILKEKIKSAPSVIDDYATGVAFGREMASALLANKAIGIKNDKTVVIAGITDVLNGKMIFTTKQVEEGMARAQMSARRARDKTLAIQGEKALNAVRAFKKLSGVITEDNGVLYRIVNSGDLKPDDDNNLRVVVRESLADGTLIQDMFNDGTALSQPISKFPPVFQPILRKLQINGEAELIVPPELAYGENGYPPKIPPGATMRYDIKIVH